WLIEDDAAVNAALALRLRSWGVHVDSLDCAAAVRAQLAACDAAQAAAPDLIVSDQRLPDGSGIDCIALVRGHLGRTVPGVIVTGDTAPADLASLRATGLPLLFKPFRAADLLSLLRSALRSATQQPA
ncbi:MAG: response regulator, partial [Rhizobacter sp.]